jgi:hypothetical protein
MLYKYHNFEGKENYPKVIEKEKETIIDYNFFFKDSISYIHDPVNFDKKVFLGARFYHNLFTENL